MIIISKAQSKGRNVFSDLNSSNIFLMAASTSCFVARFMLEEEESVTVKLEAERVPDTEAFPEIVSTFEGEGAVMMYTELSLADSSGTVTD